jgi:hypothetical protein
MTELEMDSREEGVGTARPRQRLRLELSIAIWAVLLLLLPAADMVLTLLIFPLVLVPVLSPAIVLSTVLIATRSLNRQLKLTLGVATAILTAIGAVYPFDVGIPLRFALEWPSYQGQIIAAGLGRSYPTQRPQAIDPTHGVSERTVAVLSTTLAGTNGA